MTERVLSEFKSDVKSGGNGYDTLTGHKAGAACIRWGGTIHEPYFMYSYWYYFDQPSPQIASQKSLARCVDEKAKEERQKDCNCELMIVGADVKVSPPVKPISELISDLDQLPKRPQKLCSNWFRDGEVDIPAFDEKVECPGYETNEILRDDFLIERLGSLTTTSPDIFPAAPAINIPLILRTEGESSKLSGNDNLTFSPPVIPGGYTSSYSVPKEWAYTYKLHQIPDELAATFLQRLERMDNSKLFDKFTARRPFESKAAEDYPDQQFARYVRSYDMVANADKISEIYTNGAVFPENTVALLQGERSVRLWVVATVPVDDNWTPLGAPLKTVEPLALQTNKSLYVYGKEVNSLFRYRNSHGGNVLVSYQPVFDLSKCTDHRACVKATVSTFKSELTKIFHEAPLSAELAKIPGPPGQFRFQRLYEKSNILAGFEGPWYEITTYTISVWEGGSYDGVWAEVTSAETKPEGDRIFVYVDLALQLGIGQKSKYPEPSADQYAAYQKVVQAAVQTAVANTSTRLGATVSNGVGSIVETKNSGENK
ncbi:hypothetical protein NKJ66_23365 [Mesorhizobium sp. M0078]|uniref:hypothetical protein n=1 Tax=Mesorhizobium sp. M0078 TaxID=2956871 RepID=UPI00333AB4CC